MLKIDAFFNCYLCPEIRGIASAKTGNPVNSGCIWILSKTYQRRESKEIGKVYLYILLKFLSVADAFEPVKPCIFLVYKE